MHALLRGVPFLRKGTFNSKFEVDDEVMDSIVDEFLHHDRDNPQIFIGHDKKEEYETNGVITKIYKGKYKGKDSLFYDAEIDEPLSNYLKQKKLTRCSGEFYMSNKGKKPRWYLGGMAVLGRSSSAVDIAKISKENLIIANKEEAFNQAVSLSDSGFEASFDLDINKFLVEKGGYKMTQEEIEVLVSEKLKNQSIELENLKVNLETYKNENKALKDALENKEKESESFKAEFSSLKEKVDTLSNDFTSHLSSINLFNSHMNTLTTKLTVSDESVAITSDEELNKEIRKYAKKHDLSYTDAEIEFKKINRQRIKVEV